MHRPTRFSSSSSSLSRLTLLPASSTRTLVERPKYFTSSACFSTGTPWRVAQTVCSSLTVWSGASVTGFPETTSTRCEWLSSADMAAKSSCTRTVDSAQKLGHAPSPESVRSLCEVLSSSIELSSFCTTMTLVSLIAAVYESVKPVPESPLVWLCTRTLSFCRAESSSSPTGTRGVSSKSLIAGLTSGSRPVAAQILSLS
mmetsp:Transcript_18364/g.60559  ORF Transcript_18364/g.60559 Transcript_18364/m.60559 type:complete len:200 (+) Transcript_18364:255-854(+)